MLLPVKIGKSKILRGIRGIFASKKIKKGELIESCPIILIPRKDEKHWKKTIFNNYVYEWNDDYDCFVLGHCMLTNHSYNANTIFKRDYRKKHMNYIALRAIQKDEEIFVNYNGNPSDKSKLGKEYTDYKF